AKLGVGITALLVSPFHSVALALFIGIALFHGVLGIQVVIEDYVHGRITRLLSMLVLKVGTGFIGVAAIMAILYGHIHGVNQQYKAYPTDLATSAPASNAKINE